MLGFSLPSLVFSYCNDKQAALPSKTNALRAYTSFIPIPMLMLSFGKQWQLQGLQQREKVVARHFIVQRNHHTAGELLAQAVTKAQIGMPR